MVPIVAIGASEGGVEALQEFFSLVAPDIGFAFVVIPHGSQQSEGKLAQLIRESTQMPTGEVQDHSLAEANHVYVIEPGTSLSIANGRFRVRPPEGECRDPIDGFFEALADQQGIHSVGIIMSGSGNAGASGLRAIRNAGGLAIAQSPEDAAHDGMPKSAIDAGVVHHVLPIAAMPAILIERAKAAADAERQLLLDELRRAHDRLQADLEARNRLLKVGTLFLQNGNIDSVLGEILDAAIAISAADFGNMQLLDPSSGELQIVVHRGFPTWWLDFWASVQKGHGACGTALEHRARVVVEDIERDPIFAGTPALEIQRRAGVRAVQSTPLFSRSGEPIGILSIHYRTPRGPDPRVLALLDLLARQASDILERARAEQALRDAAARFRALVDVSSEVLYRVSPDWSEIRELTSRGFLAPTQTPSKTWLEQYILPEDRPHVKTVIDRAIQTRSTFELEHRVVRADGTPGWTWSRAVPLQDARGNIVEWFGAASDVTARKHAELELAEANQRLRETDRRKTHLLAMLSHELRNPLAPIRTSLDILDRVAPGSKHAVRAFEVIHRQFGHLTRLVDDLLDITRITSGKIALQREALDLADLARRTVEDHRDAYARTGISLEVAAPSAAVLVDGDRTRLAQVLGNILHNALKFTPRGGRVRLIVEEDSARSQAVVRILDTGRGVVPEMLPYLFEPFVQADTTLDRAAGGLGLGLAVARGTIELHGGSISAASAGVGHGTTFTITLPLATSAPTPAGAQGAPERPRRGARQRVLVIDDNVDATEALRAVLELDGYEIDVAHDGRRGVQRARAFAPDIVLCDIGLPDMDGYEVARTLRGDPELGCARLVALTGYGAPEDVARSRAAGFDAHITKPVGTDALERVLSTLEPPPS